MTNFLTDEQKRITLARSRAGQLLRLLGLTHRQRRAWFTRHQHVPPDLLEEVIRSDFPPKNLAAPASVNKAAFGEKDAT